MRVYVLCATGGLLIATSLMLYAAGCGVGFTYDSQQYYAASESLRIHYTLRMANGEPYIVWTPLFPILLAIFSIQTHAWAWFNAVCLALMYTATSLLFIHQYRRTFALTPRSHQTIDIFFVVIFFVGLSIATPVHLLYHFAWSEGVFLVLLQFAFLSIYLHFATKHILYFYSLLLCSALLCLQRHAGVFFVAGFSVVILVHRGFAAALLYAAIALVGWAAWVIHIVTHYPQRSTGFIAFLGQHLLSNVWLYAREIGSWFAPDIYSLNVIALVLMVVVCWQSRGVYWQVAGVAILPYLAGISLIGAVNYSDSARLLAVLYPIVWCGIVLSLRSIVSAPRRYTHAVVLWGILLVLGYQYIRTIHNLNRWQQQSCVLPSNSPK